MAKKQGWELGEGPYAGNKGNKDPIVQGTYKDRVGGGRQLDIDAIHDHSSETGGASRKLPRRF